MRAGEQHWCAVGVIGYIFSLNIGLCRCLEEEFHMQVMVGLR